MECGIGCGVGGHLQLTNNTGSGRVELAVADNTAGARTATLLIAGHDGHAESAEPTFVRVYNQPEHLQHVL